MTKIRTLFGLLVAVVAAVVGIVTFGAAQASASSAPIVIPYAKTCDQTRGLCMGTAGGGVTIVMQGHELRGHRQRRPDDSDRAGSRWEASRSRPI